MKNKLILLAIFFVHLLTSELSGQTIHFTKKPNEPYNYLSNPRTFNPGQFWDPENSFSTKMPFMYQFGISYGDLISIYPMGYVLTSDTTSFKLYYSDFNPFYVSNIMDRGLKTGSSIPLSPIAYQIETLNGERVVKIQWKNMGFVFGGINDSINYQTWIFESGNKVQFRYGKSFIANYTPILAMDSPFVAVIVKRFDESEIYAILEGNPNNPIIGNNYPYGSVLGFPAEGTVFEFTCTLTGIQPVVADKSAFAFTSGKKLYIKAAQSNTSFSIQVFSVYGELVSKSTNEKLIDLSNCPSGVYVVEMIKNNVNQRMKVFIE